MAKAKKRTKARAKAKAAAPAHKSAARKGSRKTVTKAGKKSVEKAPKKPARQVTKKAASRETTPEKAAPVRQARPKSPLSKKQLAHFREKLIELRSRLLSNVTAMESEALKASGQDFSVDHMADHGSDNFEQDFTLSLVESERKELFEIGYALKRLEQGSYGICEGTGEVIGIPRLDAIPYTRHSVEYQRRLEAGEIREDEVDEAA